MAITEKCMIYTATILNILFTVVHLGFGIAASIILSNETDAKGACGSAIWYCIMTHAIIDMILFAKGACSCTVATTNDNSESDNKSKNKSDNTWELASLGALIWSMVIHYDTSSDCQDTFQEEYGPLWDINTAYVWRFYASLMLFAVVLIGMCCREHLR
jgi:hypothetical protein